MSANPQLIVDLSNNTGAIKHGASGFLDGLGNDGIPSENTLAPLKPQVVAQKPEGGLQNPNGDALNSSDTFRKAGGRYVNGIGNGTENALQFNHVHAPTQGLYRMVVHYSNAESRGTHSYNNQIAERCANISINGDRAEWVYFRNTFAWTNFQTAVVDIDLKVGNNTICFTNPDASAPYIDKIQIALPING